MQIVIGNDLETKVRNERESNKIETINLTFDIPVYHLPCYVFRCVWTLVLMNKVKSNEETILISANKHCCGIE